MIVRPTKRPATFVELHRRLGEVPLDGIRLDPLPSTATDKDLLKLYGPTCDLLDGVLVEQPRDDRESMFGMFFGRLIGNQVEAEDLGVVLDRRSTIPDSEGL
jgi:hypothetical protein